MRFIALDHNISILKRNGLQTVDKFGNVRQEADEYIKFRGAYYDTDDEDEIELIEGLPKHGIRIFSQVAPDDVVETGTVMPKYVCGFPKCNYETFSMDDMRSHKQEEHSKKARIAKKKVRQAKKKVRR